MTSDRDTTRHLYDTVAADYLRLLPDDSAESESDRQILRRFIEEFPVGSRVLDAGCGAGRMSRLLASEGLTVDGVDLSPAMIALARETVPAAEFRVGDLAALPYDSDSFDGVLAWYSIIHESPSGMPALLAELVRVAAPNAPLLLGFQAGDGFRTASSVYGHEVQFEAHLHTPEAIADALISFGCDIIETSTRPPREHEKHAQGFVLARVGGS